MQLGSQATVGVVFLFPAFFADSAASSISFRKLSSESKTPMLPVAFTIVYPINNRYLLRFVYYVKPLKTIVSGVAGVCFSVMNDAVSGVNGELIALKHRDPQKGFYYFKTQSFAESFAEFRRGGIPCCT